MRPMRGGGRGPRSGGTVAGSHPPDEENDLEVLLSLGSRFALRPEELRVLGRAAKRATPAAWAEAIEEARVRYTAALLCHHLRRAGVEPPEALREEYQETALANAMAEAELRRLAPALREAGASVLLIKGAALRGPVYPTAGLRPSDDSDWVVRGREDWETVTRVLSACGYEPSEEGVDITWERGLFVVELHRDILGDDRLDARASRRGEAEGPGAGEPIWRRALPAPVGEPFRIPAPEDHLLILSAHLMKHNFEPGIWFADIEGLLSAEAGLDWDAVLSRARAWGLLRPLAFAFRSMGALADEGGGEDILPRRAREALRRVSPTFLDRVLLSLAASGGRLHGEKDEWVRAPVANLLWLSSLEGPGAKARLLWEAAFPREEVMRQIYAGYRPALRGWFMLRRLFDLGRIGLRVAASTMSRRPGRGR